MPKPSSPSRLSSPDITKDQVAPSHQTPPASPRSQICRSLPPPITIQSVAAPADIVAVESIIATDCRSADNCRIRSLSPSSWPLEPIGIFWYFLFFGGKIGSRFRRFDFSIGVF
ncbi:hypothetical protein Droror1_Dr00026227 [Drosera rotundifolia]